MLNQDALDFIQANTPFAQDLLMALAQIPSPSLHEEKRAQFCKALLESWGARDAYIDEALNVVLPMDIDSGKPLVVFTAHSDVVFPDTSVLPLRDDGERLFCPGIGDNTANLTTLLLCMKYIISRRLQPRKFGVLFVANAGEEGLGNLKGTRRIDADYGSRIKEFYSFDGKINGITDHAVGSKRFRVTSAPPGATPSAASAIKTPSPSCPPSSRTSTISRFRTTASPLTTWAPSKAACPSTPFPPRPPCSANTGPIPCAI